MKKLLVKFALYALIMALLCTGFVATAFFAAAPQYREVYTGVIADKVARLESIQEPKIILVGNSNLAFGMDSAMLEKELGMPVVNLGGQGGLGNQFHYNMAKPGICPGDIVILTTTDFDDGRIQDPPLAWITIENNPSLWPMIPKEDWLEMIPSLPRYTRDVINAWLTGGVKLEESAYYRQWFNEYGDNIYLRPDRITEFNETSCAVPAITAEAVAQINAMDAFCRERGAQCLLAGYPIPDGEIPASQEGFQQLRRDLEAQLSCPVISDYTDYFLPWHYFYDTRLHLTQEGVTLRTQQLIDDLNAWLAQN